LNSPSRTQQQQQHELGTLNEQQKNKQTAEHAEERKTQETAWKEEAHAELGVMRQTGAAGGDRRA